MKVSKPLGTWALVTALAMTLICAVPDPSPGFFLPDSDQRTCYQAVSPFAEMPCAGAGQDGDFVQHPLSYTDNGDGTVTDDNTGLVWQKEDDGSTYNWYEATGIYDHTGNPTSVSVCGSFGRLPSKKELTTIVDYGVGKPGPTIHPVFTNTKPSHYWSSPAFAGYPPEAWSVNFAKGIVDLDGKYTENYVRCVRGGQISGPSLKDRGDGTVADRRTGLIWQRGEPGGMLWGAALTYCEELNLGGSALWRLPNIKELESLTDDSRWNPAIDKAMFPNALGRAYLSSSTYANNTSSPLYVHFTYGTVSFSVDSDAKYDLLFVRCVRGGESGSLADVTVTAPNGGQRWRRGSRQKITWTSTEQGGTVTIKLMKGSVTHKIITAEAANSGTYTWKLPKSLRDGKKYRIMIVSNTSPTLFDLGDRPFTIH